MQLLQVAARRTQRLMVFAPPRHGKSSLISQHLPVWWLGTFPNQRVMLASYEAGFAAGWGGKARALLDEYGPELWGIRVNPNSSARAAWDVVDLHGRPTAGGMVSTGIGGALTGRGADLLIIDDPLKGADEARSQNTRESHWDWFRSVARTRLQPNGAIVLLMTRWHLDDLAGRLLREMETGAGEEWEVLRLPALAETGDPLGRRLGDPLWPEQFSKRDLEETRRVQGSYWFECQYQGRPGPAEGATLDRSLFRYFSVDADGSYRLMQPDGTVKLAAPGQGRRIQTVDLATSERKTADYTVIATCYVTPENDLLVEDIVRERIPGPGLVPAIKAAYQRWNPSAVDVESVGFQLSVIQMLVRDGLPVRKLEAKGDKVGRAQALAARMEFGNVYFRAGAAWLYEVEQELTAFPAGQHDDVVDALAYAAIDVARYGSNNWDVAYGVVTCGSCGRKYLNPKGDRSCPGCGRQARLETLATLSEAA